MGVLYFVQLSRFLRWMTEDGVVKVEETGKGIESVTNINLKHPLVLNFSPQLLEGPTPKAQADVSTNAVRLCH